MDKTFRTFAVVFCAMVFAAGCGAEKKKAANSDCLYEGYSPVRVEILPLTEFIPSPQDANTGRINVFLTLPDAFDCQQKFPGMFRFELYEEVVRSVEPKGKRVMLWPDVDMNDPAVNSKYWRNFLRAYEFELLVNTKLDKSYILEVTFQTPSGKRLTADIKINP